MSWYIVWMIITVICWMAMMKINTQATTLPFINGCKLYVHTLRSLSGNCIKWYSTKSSSSMSSTMGGRISIKYSAIIIKAQEIWCRSNNKNYNKNKNNRDKNHNRTHSPYCFSTSSTPPLSKQSPRTSTNPITTFSSGLSIFKWTSISNNFVFKITSYSSCLIYLWVMRALMRTKTRRDRICRMRWRHLYYNVFWSCCIERETAPMLYPSSNNHSLNPNTTH